MTSLINSKQEADSPAGFLYHATYAQHLKSIFTHGLGEPHARNFRNDAYSKPRRVALAETAAEAAFLATAFCVDNTYNPDQVFNEVVVLEIKKEDLQAELLSVRKKTRITQAPYTTLYLGTIPPSALKILAPGSEVLQYWFQKLTESGEESVAKSVLCRMPSLVRNNTPEEEQAVTQILTQMEEALSLPEYDDSFDLPKDVRMRWAQLLKNNARRINVSRALEAYAPYLSTGLIKNFK